MTIRTLVFVGMLFTPFAADAQSVPRPAPAPPEAVVPVTQPTPARPQAVPAPPRGATPQPVPVERPMPAIVNESPGQVAARRAGQPVNVKVDVMFYDQTGTEPRRTKTVSVVTADGLSGYVRTMTVYEGPGGGAMPLNIDVEPRILAGGKIRLLLNVQYTLPTFNVETQRSNATVLRTAEIRENLALVMDDGKSMVVAQSADPVSDRRVTVEVLAVIVK